VGISLKLTARDPTKRSAYNRGFAGELAAGVWTPAAFSMPGRISALPASFVAPKPVVVAKLQTLGTDTIQAAIARLTEAISERHRATPNLILLGIANGGIVLAQRIARQLKSARVGTLDISFHRDDIGRNPIPKEFVPTAIPADVHGATVILVDDVLFSGRTVKAALDELFDHGRPQKVELAVLVDRTGRMLPVAADYTGLTLDPAADEKVTVHLDAQDPKADTIAIHRQAQR
jgi:pyrimidine operon attenuation protein/uracil phosphoribosyltransferase